METEARLTRLASCAGCGAKVGAGTLAKLLEDFKTHTDPRLIVGFEKSDDACVYVVNEDTALIQTVDFFPPIVDDPFLFGQIAAANAISDIYAMGGEPRLALNLLCVTEQMEEAWIREILRGGYDKAYEAGVIISGGHTIRGSDPLYGLAVTGFGLMGHSCEMAQGSGCTLHLQVDQIPCHKEALEFADMGFVPAGAYRNRDFAEKNTRAAGTIPRPVQDILYDPQTSGGLLMAVPEKEAAALQNELAALIPCAQIIGYAAEKEEYALVLEGRGEKE